VGAADVDGGSTELISPTLDLANSDSRISYSRWLYSTGGNIDPIIVEISNDGGQNWVLVDTVGPTGSTWQSATFRVNDFVAPTATVNVRFTVGDPTNDSVTEAAIDNFIVEQTQCPPAGDCNNDLAADLADHTEFHGCLAGPNGSLGTGCGCFDFDDSLAIDLHDFRELQIAIGN
jgi:hypothetical protein